MTDATTTSRDADLDEIDQSMAYNSDYTFSFELEEQVKRATAELRLLRSLAEAVGLPLWFEEEYRCRACEEMTSRYALDGHKPDCPLAAYSAWRQAQQQAQGKQ